MGVADLVLFAASRGIPRPSSKQYTGPVIGPDTAIISFQNGVLKDSYLRAHYDPCLEIMGGVGYVATTIDRSGVIRQTGPMQRLIFGEFDGRRSARGETFLEACFKGGINAELSPDIRREIWQKFVFLVGLSSTTTTMRVPIGPTGRNAQTRNFLLDVMREVVACRSRSRGRPARKLCRTPSGAGRRCSARHDLFHAPRPSTRQPIGGALVAGGGGEAGQQVWRAHRRSGWAPSDAP